MGDMKMTIPMGGPRRGKRPPRADADGSVELSRAGNRILISVTTDGVRETMSIGEFNAWRVAGLLLVMLGIPIPKVLGKASL